LGAFMVSTMSATPVRGNALVEFFRSFGANFIVATEFRIKAIYGAEPEHSFHVFSIERVLNAKDMLAAMLQVVWNSTDTSKAECGLVATTTASKSIHAALVLKCVDWDAHGEHVRRLFQRYSLEPDFSVPNAPHSHFTWMANAHGLGWKPFTIVAYPSQLWHNRTPSETIRKVLLHLLHVKCKSCFVEFNGVVEPMHPGKLWHIDVFCGDAPKNKAQCVNETDYLKLILLGDPAIADRIATPHLPDCNVKETNARTDWQSIYYGGRVSYFLLSMVKLLWDPAKRLRFWMGIGNDDNLQTCDAGRFSQTLGSTCKKANISADTLASAIIDEYETWCPSLTTSQYYLEQDISCMKFVSGRTLEDEVVKVINPPSRE